MIRDYSINDELILKINESQEIECPYYQNFRLTIIGANLEQDLVYLPHYQHSIHSKMITRQFQKWFQCEDKFLGEQGIIINEDKMIILDVIHNKQMSKCQLCKNFILRGEEEKDFRCWRCRENPYGFKTWEGSFDDD